MKKERWTEPEVLSFPNEHDQFERKRGGFVKDDRTFRETLAKALSALANSGGGHLALGVENDGKIDGVLPVIKGKQRTREWLEQVIPTVLDYPLQDFRVHEVEPDNPTSIPKDKVVIVIDVGDSQLGPHQDIFTKMYFHRVGGHSEPAPHRYLDLLRNRETYPNQKIAHTWLNFVIRRLLSKLGLEGERLNDLILRWDFRKKELDGISCFYVNAGGLSANQLQFLESYPEIRSKIEAHDAGVSELSYQLATLASQIQLSETFRNVYARSISDESLLRVRRSLAANADLTDSSRLLSSLFGTMTQAERQALLSQHILNREADLDASKMVWPLWNPFRKEFMTTLEDPLVVEQNERVDKAHRGLYATVTNLIAELQEIRNELARRHGEVWEDETLTRWTPPSGPDIW